MSDLSKKFKKACRNFTIGTALVTTMVGGTMGLATPKDAHALSNAELAGIAAGGVVLLGLGYKAFAGGGSGSSGPAVDPRCSTTVTQSQNYGYSFGGSTNTSIYCPPATSGYSGGGYQAVQQPQQVVVQQAPARSSADIEKERMMMEEMRHERQMRAIERDADFYSSVPGIRMQQATGFCMNVTDGKSLDAPNRKDCAKILNRSAKGQAFLASMGRSDLLSGELRGGEASGGGDGALCQTETVKESYGADGKLTGRTIEKAMKPCNPKM